MAVDAQISDDTAPGIYLVKLKLPKRLQAGAYDLKITLKGADITTPAILVKPCTNTISYTELGILEGSGNTNELEPLNYTLSFPSKSIELPSVKTYCDHQPIQILQSAKATFLDGS